MKTPVKELLTSRLAIIALALAAIVGICAFSFSGVQDNAWADDEEVIDTWADLNTTCNSDNEKMRLDISWPGEGEATCKATITNLTGEPIPASTLYLNTVKGIEMTASFGDEIGAGGTATAEIEGSVATTGFRSAILILTPAPQPETVNFDRNGHGVEPEDKVIEKGAALNATDLPPMEEEGWTFNGWFLDGMEFQSGTVFNENAILVASWTENEPEPEPAEQVTIAFESEFGTTPEAMTVNKGQVVELPDLGTDGDYEFEGWILKGSEGAEPFIGEYTAEENVTFSAVWKTPSTPPIEMVSVTFDMNGHGDNVTNPTEKGKPITLIDNPTAEGYTFKGWTYDKEGKQAFDPKKNADQDTTLYAQWEKKAEPKPDPDTPDNPSDNPADKPGNGGNGNGSNATKPTESTPTDFTIAISKTDAKTGKALSGAEFTLADKAGDVVDSWTSDGTSRTYTLDRGTSYVLTETKAPTGYNREKAININFSTDDGKAAVKIDQGGRAVALPVNNDGNAALNVKDLSGTALQGTSTTAPKTGDNQNMPLASLCFGAAALVAGGIAATAYRKRQAL